MYKVGDVVVVENPTMSNQVGGTSSVKGRVRARIVDTWNDRETGKRFVGKLIEEKDIELAKESGKVDFSPESYRQYGREHYAEARRVFDNWDPTEVYFGESDEISKEI